MNEIIEYTFDTLIGASVKIESNGIQKIKNITDIEIPRIQRDYAQGRTSKSVTKIRNNFLTSLYDTIVNGKHITLDFIYGDIEEELASDMGKESKIILTPLDGQQRLTTLYLLHWFIAKKENILEQNYSFLKHFSYSTRISSRDFCKDLINYEPDFSNLVFNNEQEKKSLSSTIKDQAWFQFDWKYDPTIQSMLVMLDTIYDIFYKTENLWDKLKDAIGFYFLPLYEMGLSDELYIKMNSRGKPLTPFEHFKADFEKNIKVIDNKQYDYFTHHFDVEWAEIFFPFRGSNNIIDDEMLRYFKFVCSVLCYEQDLDYDEDEYKLANIVFGDDNQNRKKNLEYLKLSFDCLENIDLKDFYENNFINVGYESDKITLFHQDINLFDSCCSSFGDYVGRNRKFSLNKYILFYANLIYFENKESISLVDFKKRFRIIRNLVWNSAFNIRDDKPDRMKNLLAETKKIMINGVISEPEENIVSFNSTQMAEERDKLIWLNDPQNAMEKESLLELESLNLLKGCIAVVGLENKKHFEKFIKLFNNKNDYDAINRALLSIDDYSQFIGWRYQLGAKSKLSTWIDLFHPSEQRPGFDKTKATVNTLLDSVSLYDNESLNEFANNYISNSDTKKDWRYYLIKYDEMRAGFYGMYFWKNKYSKDANPYEIIMMKTEKSLGGYNWELFSKCLQQRDSKHLTMGNYSYSNEDLQIKGKNIFIYIKNSEFYLKMNNEVIKKYTIPQGVNGIDTVDRIEFIEEKLKDYY